MRLSFFTVAAVLLLAGCNTYFQNTYDKITVSTPGVENADCDLYTLQNRYAVMTPRVVTVERSHLPMTIVCRKTGYYQASVIVKPGLRANAAAMNIFNGIVPGVAYDVVDNSIYDYPDTIIVTLQPTPPEKYEQETPYVLEKKPEPVKPAPVETAPPPAAADKALSKSGKK